MRKQGPYRRGAYLSDISGEHLKKFSSAYLVRAFCSIAKGLTLQEVHCPEHHAVGDSYYREQRAIKKELIRRLRRSA